MKTFLVYLDIVGKDHPRESEDGPGQDSPCGPVAHNHDVAEGNVGLGGVCCHRVPIVDNGDGLH